MPLVGILTTLERHASDEWSKLFVSNDDVEYENEDGVRVRVLKHPGGYKITLTTERCSLSRRANHPIDAAAISLGFMSEPALFEQRKLEAGV